MGGRDGPPLGEGFFYCGYTGRKYDEMGKDSSVLPEYSEGGNRPMEGSLKELAEYRLERANEMLSASESNLEIGQYKTSLNRAYYAIDLEKHKNKTVIPV